MAIKFKYYDDAPYDEVSQYIRVVEGGAEEKDLVIDHDPPRKYDKQIKLLRELTKENYDGVIFDLRLDIDSNVFDGNPEKANYRATTLAQELRTLGTEGKVDEMPIVLWSLDRRLKESYLPDETAHDLFDLTSPKSKLETPEGGREMASWLISLAEGYQEVTRIQSENSQRKRRYAHKFLGFDEAPDFLDRRIVTYFDDRSGLPVHEYARFVLHSMLDKPGPLIEERILAARLGIEIDDSDDWGDLKEHLADCEYRGPFREGWPRWWWHLVNEWWKEQSPPASLKRLEAEKRVEILREKTGLAGLVAAEPIEEEYSTRFWTVCLGFEEPLDPVNGIRVKDENIQPWMDRPYVSQKAALDRRLRRRKGLQIDPLEQARYERIKTNR